MLKNGLKSKRLGTGLKQYELGAKAGVHPGTISLIENQKLVPSPGQKRKLAKALHVEVEEIFPEK